MTRRCCTYLIVLLSIISVSKSQEQYTHLSLGASAGKGYAVDIAYGKLDKNPGGHDQGGELVFSVWTPEYRFPVANDNTRLTTSDDYISGAYIESGKENKIGFGIGMRYAIKPIALGGMFDMVMLNRYDYYRNPNDNSLSHLRSDATLGGWTVTIALYLTDRITTNGFYGTQRGFNAGLAWTIINP